MVPVMREHFNKILEEYDVIITPTLPYMPSKIPDKDSGLKGWQKIKYSCESYCRA